MCALNMRRLLPSPIWPKHASDVLRLDRHTDPKNRGHAKDLKTSTIKLHLIIDLT